MGEHIDSSISDLWNCQDRHFMTEALRLAKTNPVRTSPNPSVGCVIVRYDTIIGKGATGIPGQGHAEVAALEDCSQDPAGATVYITLEPCTFLGRTDPCSDVLIKARVAKVIFAIEDPNPLMTQSADHVLTGGGIEVRSGLLAKEAEAVHADFLFRQRNGRPKIPAKMAVTLDGCAAKLDGSSKWITGFLARTQVHTIRSQVDAILTSTRTMLVDRARYNVRHVVCSRDPDLIVLGDSVPLLGSQPELDREGIVFFHTAGHRTDAPTLKEAKVTKVQGENCHAYPTEVAKALSELNYNSVLLEAGPQMLKSF